MLALLAAGLVAVPDAMTPANQMPNLYSQPAACRDQPYHVVDRYGRPVARRLGDLPHAGAQLLVDRKVEGCRVVTLMSGSAGPAPVGTPPAGDRHRIEPVQPK